MVRAFSSFNENSEFRSQKPEEKLYNQSFWLLNSCWWKQLRHVTINRHNISKIAKPESLSNLLTDPKRPQAEDAGMFFSRRLKRSIHNHL
jgi:hypothetical protein